MWKSVAPEIGAPFDPKASCSVPESPAVSDGSINLDPTWRSNPISLFLSCTRIHDDIDKEIDKRQAELAKSLGYSHKSFIAQKI